MCTPENDFLDYNREPLMPHVLSAEGPALAVGDVNGDGLDDLYVGGAKWQRGTLLLQQRDGRFAHRRAATFATDSVAEDVDATFFDADGDGDLDLYVVSAGNEFWERVRRARDRLYLNDGTGAFTRRRDALPREARENGGTVTPVTSMATGISTCSWAVAWWRASTAARRAATCCATTAPAVHRNHAGRGAPGLATAGLVTDARGPM
jgi:hypothetical protein